MTRKHAFTLIELLIVVAIIAILAAIAVPNFLEAQTRAKISRVKADLRTVVIGLESYMSDNNKYPYPRAGIGVQKSFIWWCTELTTPISYLTSVNWIDPFTPINWGKSSWNELKIETLPFMYVNYGGFWASVYFKPGEVHNAYVTYTNGPDRWPNFMEWGIAKDEIGKAPITWAPFNKWNTIYDPTNGTLSAGDIGRYGGEVQNAPPI